MELFRKALQLRALAASVQAFEGDELTARSHGEIIPMNVVESVATLFERRNGDHVEGNYAP